MWHTRRISSAFTAGAVLAAGILLAPPAGAVDANARTVQDDVVRLTNAERQKAGCPALTPVAALSQAAQNHSNDMAAHNFMNHTGSDGSSAVARVERSGYTGWHAVAENVAAGHQTAENVVSDWMSSSGHRANILNCQLKEVGVGYATHPDSTYGTYWTQDFGSR